MSQSTQSKTSTSAVTYQYEFDVYEDNDEMQAKSTLDVKRRMEEDGISLEDIQEFLRIAMATKNSQNGFVEANNSTEDRSLVPSMCPVNVSRPPVPPCPPPPLPPPTPPKMSKYGTYDRMRGMGTPEGAVRHKMMADGHSTIDIDIYFNSCYGEEKALDMSVSCPPPSLKMAENGSLLSTKNPENGFFMSAKCPVNESPTISIPCPPPPPPPPVISAGYICLNKNLNAFICV